MRSKTLLCLTAFVPALMLAQELPSFNAIYSTVQSGAPIRVAVDFSQCTPAIGFTGYYAPKSVMLIHATTAAPASLAFSNLHFTLNDPATLGNPVYENVGYQLVDQGSAPALKITTTVFSVPDYLKKGKQMVESCPLNTAAKFYASVGS